MTDAKKSTRKKGLVIPKTVTSLPPREIRRSIPGELWAAIELAAKTNGVKPDEVVVFALTKALRSELAQVKKDIKAGKFQESEAGVEA